MCLIIAVVIGFAIGMWFQGRRGTLRTQSEITHATWEAQQASRRLADAAATARRQMLHRADQEQGDS